MSTIKTITECLSSIIQNYQHLEKQPKKLMNEILHYHEKNPSAKLQIMLLEKLRDYIGNNLTNPHEQRMAELGALLILKALLSDTTPEGKVYYYLIEKLGLNKEIAKVLKHINPSEEMDPTHADYINISEDAIRFCKSILEKPEVTQTFPAAFLKDLFSTIAIELDYDDRLLYTINPPKM